MVRIGDLVSNTIGDRFCIVSRFEENKVGYDLVVWGMWEDTVEMAIRSHRRGSSYQTFRNSENVVLVSRAFGCPMRA